MDNKVLIIIPAFNEEASIGNVLRGLQQECPDYDVLVINDASTDNTSSIARLSGSAMVVDLPVNLGIGGAVQTGLRFASRRNYNCAIQFDGDGQHRAEDVSQLVNMVLSGECDVAIGSRFIGDSQLEGKDIFRRFGIRIFEIFTVRSCRSVISRETRWVHPGFSSALRSCPAREPSAERRLPPPMPPAPPRSPAS